MSTFDDVFRDAFFEHAHPIMRKLRDQVRTQAPAHGFLDSVRDSFYDSRTPGEPLSWSLSFHCLGNAASKFVILKMIDGEKPGFFGLKLDYSADGQGVWLSREHAGFDCSLRTVDELKLAIKQLDWRIDEIVEVIKSEWARVDSDQQQSVPATATSNPPGIRPLYATSVCRTGRMDPWASFADAPTAEPGKTKIKGAVSRGMSRLKDAVEYADHVAMFFAQNGACSTVFVVRGPTSTTSAAFEVVEACCGYTIVHKTGISADAAMAAKPIRVFHKLTLRDLKQVEPGDRAIHAKHGEVVVCFDQDVGWNYKRFGFAGFGTDFDNLSSASWVDSCFKKLAAHQDEAEADDSAPKTPRGERP